MPPLQDIARNVNKLKSLREVVVSLILSQSYDIFATKNINDIIFERESDSVHGIII